MQIEDIDSLTTANGNLNASPAGTGISPIETAGLSPTPSRPISVNFSDPYQRPTVSVGSSRDPFQLDSDPFGERTVQYGLRIGKPYTQTDVLSLNVFGREMGYEQLNKTDAGRRLIEIAQNNRAGKKRGFWEALTDFQWSDLPFVSLVASVGGSIQDAVTVSDTFKKLQNGEQVSDDELIKARLSMAESEYRSNGGIGSMIGDIVRAAPGFMAEFFASGGMLSAARAGLAMAGKESANWMARVGISRVTKMATDSAAERIAGSFIKNSVKSAGADAVLAGWKSLNTAAGKELRDSIIDSIAGRISGSVAEDLGKSAAAGMVEAVAKRRATIALERQILRNTADTAVGKWFVGAQRSIADHASRALIDFGKFGTEVATLNPKGLGSAWSYLGDAVNTFLVEAPIRGAMISMPQQFIANPLIGLAFGKDNRTVSSAELSLQESALRTGNKQLMADAHAIAFGINFLEYASESSGRGFDSLFKAAGTALVPAKRLGRTAIDGALDAADGLISRDKLLEAGSWFRNILHKAFGTGSDMAKGLSENRDAAVRAMFRSAEEAAAKSGRNFTKVTEEALQRFMVGEGKDLSVLGSAEAARLVSEAGGFDSFLKEAVKKGIKKQELGVTFKRYTQYVLADKMHRLGLTPDATVDWLRTAGYDGLVQEMMEERYSDFAKGLFGLDERTQDEKGFIKNTAQAFKNLWPGWDQLVAEAVGFSVPMGVRMAVNHIQRAAGGSNLTKLQYYADQLRNLHAGTFVETKTSSWFKEADGRISNLEEQVKKETDETKKAELNAALEAARNQRKRVEESIGGAAQVMSDRIRFLEAPNTQVTSEAQARRHETPTAEASAKAAAIYEFLVNEAGNIGRTLDDMQSQAPGEHVPFWNRIASRVAGITGAIVTGDLSLAQMNPAAWSMVDRGFDESLVDELTALSKFHDGRARSRLIREAGATVADVGDKRKANEKEIADLNDKISKTTNQKEKDKLNEKLLAATEKRTALDAELEEARSRQAEKLGISKETVRSRSDAEYRDAASKFMRSWLSDQGYKFFQQSEMRSIAIGRLVDQYGFTPGKTMKVNGSDVNTIEEFAAAVSSQVDQVQNDIADLTLRIVHNRDINGTTGNPYDMGGHSISLINIPANSPLYKDSLLAAALEQAGFSDSFECSELTDNVPLSKVVSRAAIPMAQIAAVASMYDAVTADEDLTTDQLALVEKLAKTWGFGLSAYSPTAINTRNREVVDLARKVSQLREENVVTWSKAKTDGVGVYDDSAETVRGKDVIRATMVQPGAYRWSIQQEDGTVQNFTGTESKMTKDLEALGYGREEPTVSFGHVRRFTSRSAAMMIEKFALVDKYLAASGKTNAETDLDPRFRTEAVLDPVTREPVGRRRVYTSQKADEIRQQEVTAANRWYRNAISSDKELDEGTIRSNYGDKYDEQAANDKKMYERVYRHRDGSNGYLIVENDLLRSYRFTAPSIRECLEENGVIENPYRDTVAAYQGMPQTVTPLGGANTYVFIDHRNSHISYDAAIVRHVVNNALLSHWNLIAGDKGGVDDRSKKGFSGIVNRFFTRCRAETNRLIQVSADAGRESEAKSMLEFYNRLFGGVKDQCIRTDTLVQLITDVVVAQAERDNANGRTRLHDASPIKRLVRAVRRSPEFVSMVALTDVLLGGDGFSLGTPKRKPGDPLKGLARLVSVMSGDNVYKFMSDIRPDGMDSTEFWSKIRTSLSQELQSRGQKGSDITEPTGDATFSEWVHDIAVVAKCDTPDKFDEFFRAVLVRAGVLAGNVDIADWKSVIAEQETEVKIRRANKKALQTTLIRLRKENEELKQKLKEALEREPEGDHSAEAAQIAENETDIAQKQEELDRIEGVVEGEGKPAAPKQEATTEAPKTVLNEQGEDVSMDFDDQATAPEDGPEAKVQADPEGKKKAVWTVAVEISDELSDFESGRDNDEVLAAVQCLLPLAVITEGGTPTDGEQIRKVFNRFVRSYSAADFKHINDRMWDVINGSHMAESEMWSRFLSGADMLQESDVSEALSSAMHDYLGKGADEGTGTAENEKFGDKALSVFKALSPLARVLAAVRPECGKNLQGFLSVVRGELDEQIRRITESEADDKLDSRAAWLSVARSLLSQRASDIEGETFANRCAAHIATVDRFTNGTPEANRLLHGLIRELAADDGTGQPVNAELAVFFSYIASLPKGIRMGVLSIASGMTAADTVRVYHTAKETEFDPVTEETNVIAEEQWSIHPSKQSTGKLTSAAIVSAFSRIIPAGGASKDSVRKTFDGLYADALAAVKGTAERKFIPTKFDYKTFSDTWTASQTKARAMVYKAFVQFKENCETIASIVEKHLGRGNSLSAVLRSADLYRRIENDIGYSDQSSRLSTLGTVFSQFSKAAPHPNDKVKQFIPYPVRDILALLLKLTVDADTRGVDVVYHEDLEAVVQATFNNGNVNAGDAATPMVTATKTDVWTTLFNDFASALPRTSVMSDIVEHRTESGDRPHVAVSMRGTIPIVERWMEDESSDPYSFRALAMANLRKELQFEFVLSNPKSDAEAQTKYIEDQIAKMGGEEEIITEAQRTMRWPGRRNLPIIARNTTVDYEGAEVNLACREQFVKQAKKDGRWFVPLYSGDHSSNNLIQIPIVMKEMLGKDGKTLIPYKKAAKLVNDATGVTLMGDSAKRSAISSADAEQVPMAGCTIDIGLDENGAPVVTNAKYGENRIVIVSNPGVAARDSKGNPIRFTNEDMKGSMLAAGFGPEMFRKMAKNPKFRLEKLHFISHGRDLGFLKSATNVVGADGLTDAGAFPEDSFMGALTRHILGYYTAEELKRSSVTLADYDSYKVGPAMAKADQGVGVVVAGSDEPVDLVAYVLDVLNKKGVKNDIEAEELDKIVGTFEWRDDLRGTREKDCTVSKILGPGAMVRVVENVYGNEDGNHPMLAFSYVDNSVMGIKAANISHGSAPEVKRNNKNYTTDAITRAVGQTLDIGEDTNFVQREVIDTLTGYAALAGAIAVHEPSIAAELADDPRLQRELDNGADEGSQAYIDKRSDIEASRLRKAMLAPLRKVDAGLVTLGSFNPVKGSDGKWHIVDHTASMMRRRCHQGSMVFSDEDASFYGARLNDHLRGRLRRLGLAEVNVRNAAFRYGWFLDKAKFLELANEKDEKGKNIFADALAGSDTDPERNILLQIEAVFTTLRKYESNNEIGKATSLRDKLGNCFKNHHGQYIGTVTDAKGTSIVRKVCFEDLFTSDGTETGRVFDRSAVYIGKDKVPITTLEKGDAQPGGKSKYTLQDTEDMIFLAGSTIGVPRTPSYNGSMWNQTCRASFPVTEKRDGDGVTAKWSVGDDALVALDPQTLYILGCDNDGDEAAIYFYGATGGVAPFAKGLAEIGASMDVEAGLDSSLASVYDRTVEGDEVDHDGKDEKARKSRSRSWLMFKNGKGDKGYELSPYAKNAVSNTLVRGLFDMARQTVVPSGTEERMFIGSLSDTLDANGRRTFDGNETGPCKAWLTDDKSLWKGFVAKECPPDALSGNGSTIGDIDTQQAVEQSAKDAASARAAIVRMAEHLHVAMISGLFGDFKVKRPKHDSEGNVVGEYERTNSYRLFRGSLTNAQWVAFMRHVDGLSNMTFDDLKERICSRVGLNQQMVDTLFADLLSGPVVPSDDIMFINAKNGEYSGLFANYVKSVRDKKLVDGKWVDRVNAKTTGSLLGSSLSLSDNASRMFMIKASSSHAENQVYRNAIAAKLFGGATGTEAKEAHLMNVLGLSRVFDEDRTTNDETHVRIGMGAYLTISNSVDRNSAKYVIAQSLLSGFRRAGEGAKFGEFLTRVCRGNASSGLSVEAGYLAWLLGAANGKLAKVGTKAKFDGSVSELSVAVRQFFNYMNVSGVISKLHDFAGAIQFVQADPGHPDALRRSDRYTKAYEDVVREGWSKVNGTLRGTTLEKMRRATKIAYSSDAVRSGSSEARVTRARGVLSDIDLAGSVDLEDEWRLNGQLVQEARNRGNHALADLLANLNDQLEREHNDLVPENIRLMGDNQKHGMYIPAAAQVVAGMGGLMATTGDVFRFSERVARASARHAKMPEEHPLDVLHFRRGVEALFETVFALASTSEEGISNSAFSYLFSTEERRNGYTNAVYGRNTAGTGFSGSNTLRTIRTLFSTNTPDSFRKMQTAFLLIAEGALDGKPRTWANKGRDINPNKPEQWKSEAARRMGSTHDISISNLDKFVEETKSLRSDKRGPERTLADSIVLAKEVIRQIAEWKDVNPADVVIRPSDLVKQILPWYTVVLDKIDGSPSYDQYSGSMVNCFPGFYRALSRQQAANDARFRSFSDQSKSGREDAADAIPYVDLLSALNNAPVNRRKSAEATRAKMKANGRKATRALVQTEIDRALAGEPGTDAVIIRRNPTSRNLFDIFRGGIAEKVTEVYNALAGESVENALDGIEAERQRLRKVHEAKAAAKAKTQATRAEVSTVANVKTTSEAVRAAEVAEWSLGMLAKANPGKDMKTWDDFVAAYPEYKNTIERWRKAGVEESLLSNREFIMYRFAQEENLLFNDPEPEGRLLDGTGDWHDNRGTRRTVADKSTQKKGTGNLDSLFADHDAVIVYDTETSGLDSDKHHVVQIGAVKYVRSADGTVKEAGRISTLIRLPEGETMTEGARDVTGITDEMLMANGGDMKDTLSAFASLITDNTVLVGHNVKFDAGMLNAAFARNGMRGALSRCDWLDTATVAGDRFGFKTFTHVNDKGYTIGNGHKLETCIKYYGLTGAVKNSHDAADDAEACAKVLMEMDKERDDLAGYLNIIGYRPGHGAPLSSVAGLVYVPQTVNDDASGMVVPSETLSRATIPEELVPPEDTPVPDHKTEPKRASTALFAKRLETALKRFEAVGADTSVRVEGNTIIVERNVVGDKFRKRIGHDVRTVVRIEMGEWGPSTQHDQDGNPVAIDLNNPAVIKSMLASVCSRNGGQAYRKVTVDQMLAMPYNVRLAFAKKYCPTSVRYGMGGHTGHSPMWAIDTNGLQTLCSGIRLNAATASEKEMFHEYFHASMSMMLAMGAITEKDCENLGKQFKPTGKKTDDPRTWYNEEELAIAFGAFAASESAKTDEAFERDASNVKKHTTIFRRILDFLQGIAETLKGIVMPNGFSYAEEGIEVMTEEGEKTLATRDILFNMVLSGAIVESRETSESAAVQRLYESNRATKAAALGEETMRRLSPLGGSNMEDPFAKMVSRRAEPQPDHTGMPVTKTAKNPDGTEIRFSADTHTYWSYVPGKGRVDYVSGTTFNGAFFMFDREGKIADIIENGSRKYAGMTAEQIAAEWDKAGEAASRLGTRTHSVIEAELAHQTSAEAADETEALIFPTAVAVAKALSEGTTKFGKLRDIEAEKIVFDPKSHLAGTIDFLGIDEGGAYVMIDHKTNKDIEKEMEVNVRNGANNPIRGNVDETLLGEYSLQLNLYRKLLVDSGVVPTGAKFRMAINYIDHEGEQRFIDVKDMSSVVEAMVAYARRHAPELQSAAEALQKAKALAMQAKATIENGSEARDEVEAIMNAALMFGVDRKPEFSMDFSHEYAAAPETKVASGLDVTGQMTQDVMFSIADEIEPGNGVNADDPQTVIDHVRISRALTTLISDGIKGLSDEQKEYLQTVEPSVRSKEARDVAKNALQTLASMMGTKLPPAESPTRKLMFRAVRLAYDNFMTYEFNRKRQSSINAAKEHTVDKIERRANLTNIGLTAGVLIQSGVTHQNIVEDTIGQLREILVANRKSNPTVAKAVQHLLAQVTRLSNNDKYAKYAFDEVQTGFNSKTKPGKRGTADYQDYEPLESDRLAALPNAKQKIARRNIQKYPYKNKDFQRAMKLALRGMYLMTAARNYSKLAGEPIVGTGGRDITYSLGRTVNLATRNFSVQNSDTRGFDGVTTQMWKNRAEFGEPLPEREVAAGLGLAAEDLVDLATHENPSSSVGFIMSDPEGWLLSTLRPRFRGKDLRDISRSEHNEMTGLIGRLRDKANWWTRYLGLDMPVGQKILSIHEETADIRLENGAQVRDENSKAKRLAFHARQRRAFKLGELRGNVEDVILDNLDHEEIDWALKSADAWHAGQRVLFTSIGDLTFGAKEFLDENGNARTYRKEDFTPEKVRERFLGDGMQSRLDTTLWRMIGADDASSQLPLRILYGNRADGSGFGFYDRFVSGVVDALNQVAKEFADFQRMKGEIREYTEATSAGREATLSDETIERWVVDGNINEDAYFDVSSRMLDLLERAGLVTCQREQRNVKSPVHEWEGSQEMSVAVRGAVTMNLGELEEYWKTSASFAKLVKAGRDGDMLSFQALGADAMKLYREAQQFAKKNRWITDGDGSLLNGFGSHVPFLAGSGAFKWKCERVGMEKKEITERLSDAEREFAEILNTDDGPATANQWRFLFDRLNVRENDVSSFRRAVWRGEYAAGERGSNASGIVITPEDAGSCQRMAAVIYSRIHEVAFNDKAADETMVKKLGGRAAIANMVDMYDTAASGSAALVGSGLNAEQMFRAHGVLPANTQVFHHVETVVGQLARTIQFRNTLAGFLTSQDANGRPIAYIRPSMVRGDEHRPDMTGSDESIVPEALWEQIARWWVDANPELSLKYDEACSGRVNAARLYDAIMKTNGGTVGGRKFTALDESYMKGVKTIAQFAVVGDTDDSDHSSVRNRLNGGEALGYAKQLFSIPRIIGGDFQSTFMQRVSSWSKTLSVQCSLFFPIATRIESSTGAVGFWTMLCSNTSPKSAEAFGKALSAFDKIFQTDTGAVLNRNFVGMQDIMDMMDSNDPFLEDCRDICAALGISLSDKSVNPAEGDKSYVEADIRRLTRAARKILGDQGAQKVQNVLDGFLFRGSERAFTYVLNATKIATALQIAQKLQAKAHKEGRAFDIIRDLKPYGDYINAEIGGIDPLRYAWASPKFRKMMSIAMFSWEWTKGAWSAGGGEILEDAIFGGHMTNPAFRQQMLGRWLRMYGTIMIGVPAMAQIACKVMGKCLGWDDDNDKWFTFDNEEKIGMSAFDLTPLLKGLGTIGFVKDVKDLPIVGTLMPGYTGNDDFNTSKNRRYYMHFGKQGWEFFRWFTHPWEQMMSKLSMPTQRVIEGLAGYNPANREYDLPFSNMSLMERWLNPTTDGATFNLVKSFIPFSANALSSYGDAGALSILGPVKMGTSRRKVINDLKAALTAWANNERAGYSFGAQSKTGWLRNHNRVSVILRDAQLNGIEPSEALKEAVGQVQVKYYRDLYRDISKLMSGEDVDEESLRKTGRKLNRLGAKLKNAFRSLKSQAKHTGIDWGALPKETKALMKSVLNETLTNPFGNPNKIASPGVDDEARRAARLSFDY